MLSCLIDAKEHRDVATVDIPGAFMQADMEDLVHMKLEGKMAELLVKLDPKLYQKYVQSSRNWTQSCTKSTCKRTMENKSYTLSSRKLYMEHSRRLYYSGRNYQRS
jgi:hypothetical protein